MAENKDRDSNPPADTSSGTTSEKDFGKTDRYANKDREQDFNFTTTGDGSAWDSGRSSSAGRGTHNENDLREADAEAPGVSGDKPNR
jgi:hypothetical protein